MTKLNIFQCVLLCLFTINVTTLNAQDKKSTAIQNINQSTMMIRVSEIEIIPAYLEEYNAILREESSASVKIEPGVIAIYPMYQKENPNQIRILEIYAGQEAYKSHLQTPHFLHYKKNTLKMVKSLKLVDMASLDPATMPLIFKKTIK